MIHVIMHESSKMKKSGKKMTGGRRAAGTTRGRNKSPIIARIRLRRINRIESSRFDESGRSLISDA